MIVASFGSVVELLTAPVNESDLTGYQSFCRIRSDAGFTFGETDRIRILTLDLCSPRILRPIVLYQNSSRDRSEQPSFCTLDMADEP